VAWLLEQKNKGSININTELNISTEAFSI